MTETNKNIVIITSSAAACVLMYLIEQYFRCSYVYKTALKIILFAGLPLLYSYISGTGTVWESLGINHIRLKNLKAGYIFGTAAFLIIFAAYFFLGNLIDFDMIRDELQTKLKITARTFIFTGLYIIFINSLIEELFFRGYIFLGIYNTGLRKTASAISSFLFGLYHMAIFRSWFSIPLTILAVSGLIITGIIFNFLNIKNRNFLNSWIIHIFADTALILIGIKMFYF